MNDEAPKAKRFRIGWWTPIGVLLAVGGAVLLMQYQSRAPEPIIDRIRISESATLNHPGGAADSAIERLKRTLSKPDYYLRVIADTGEQDTDIRYNTPIGNGLTFTLKTAVPLSALQEVRVMHEGLISDPIVDRVDVSAMEHDGQLFTFQMMALPPDVPPQRWPTITGWSLLGVGGLLVLSTVVRFVWQQVV